MTTKDVYPLADSWNEERQAYVVDETENYWIDVVPMIFNHRVVMTPKNSPGGYDFGWCYPDLLSAVAAVLAWKPAEEPEPAGYKKRATPVLRTVRDL